MKDILLFMLVPFSIIMITFLLRRKKIMELYDTDYNNLNFVEAKNSHVTIGRVETYADTSANEDKAKTNEDVEDSDVDEEELQRILNEPVDWSDYDKRYKNTEKPLSVIKEEKESLKGKWKRLRKKTKQENKNGAQISADSKVKNKKSSDADILFGLVGLLIIIINLMKCNSN